jgi:hypothetical protein
VLVLARRHGRVAAVEVARLDREQALAAEAQPVVARVAGRELDPPGLAPAAGALRKTA